MPVERSERARAVLRTLLTQYLKTNSTHPIGKDSDVRQVFLMDDGTAVVDTSAAFADSHPSGVLAEELTVASIVVTLNANDSKITRVKILVNGQERETLAGHADLKRFYEASQHGPGRERHAVAFSPCSYCRRAKRRHTAAPFPQASQVSAGYRSQVVVQFPAKP